MVKKIIIIDPGVKIKDVVKFLPEGTEVVILRAIEMEWLRLLKYYKITGLRQYPNSFTW